MPQWAGSCWYYLRFLDPTNHEQFIDPEIEKAWMPVDLYVGGAEHAVLHLLYSRFWHKVLYDRGYVSTVEPFARLVNQGMILGEVEFTGYRGSSGGWVSAGQQSGSDIPMKVSGEHVESKVRTSCSGMHRTSVWRAGRIKCQKVVGTLLIQMKLSVTLGLMRCDSMRCLWDLLRQQSHGVHPVLEDRNFLDRCWRLVVDEGAEVIQLASQVTEQKPTDEQMRAVHRMLDKVTSDIESLSFNTAIAKMMEF